MSSTKCWKTNNTLGTEIRFAFEYIDKSICYYTIDVDGEFKRCGGPYKNKEVVRTKYPNGGAPVDVLFTKPWLEVGCRVDVPVDDEGSPCVANPQEPITPCESVYVGYVRRINPEYANIVVELDGDGDPWVISLLWHDYEDFLWPVEGAKQVDTTKCKYAGSTPPLREASLHDFYTSPKQLGPQYTYVAPKYDQPIMDQIVTYGQQMIRDILRTTREVPLCNITGQPVEVEAIATGTSSRDKIGVYYKCAHCK